MKIINLSLLITCFASAIVVSGCTKSGGDQFIGSWGVMNIEKNGELYNITNAKTNAPFPFCAAGASYKAGKLDCGTGLVFSFDAKKDKVIMTFGLSSDELSRAK